MAESDENDLPEESEGRKKGFGAKLMGLFVETAPSPDDDGLSDAQLAELARKAPKAPPVEVAPPPRPVAAAPLAPGERPPTPAGYKAPDFHSIFKSVGMADDERDRLAKAEELLRNLPAETPITLKKQIVEASLRAFAISPEKITAAANRAVGALDTYVKLGSDDVRATEEQAIKKIGELNAEIERLQKAISDKQLRLRAVEFDVKARQQQLRDVLAFFQTAPEPTPASPPPTKS